MEYIILSGKKELDIYVNPQRQNILRCMQIKGEPMTPKQIADQVGISASSVQRHIRLLKELGIVEQSRARTDSRHHGDLLSRSAEKCPHWRYPGRRREQPAHRADASGNISQRFPASWITVRRSAAG